MTASTKQFAANRKLLTIWLLCFLPFLFMFIIKFVSWWNEIDSGVTREREGGIHHTVSNAEIAEMSLRSAVNDTWIFGIGGLVAAIVISSTLKKKTASVPAE